MNVSSLFSSFLFPGILLLLVAVVIIIVIGKKKKGSSCSASEVRNETAAFMQTGNETKPEVKKENAAKPTEMTAAEQSCRAEPEQSLRTEPGQDRALQADEAYPLALPAGSILAGQYIIQKTLGQGGFGITYQAVDHRMGRMVAVKEFFPDTMAVRVTRTTVTAFSGERGESFSYGKGCFLQEAETLAQFIGNENIARVYNYFEENGTAYFVMEYIEGMSFDRYIKYHGGKVSYEEAEKILLPVIDALAAVHARGIVHRDVTPDNIYITKEGRIKLLDFGAARYSLGDRSRSLDVVLKHGFAPKEQYTRHGRQGPFTDVYTVGATFYFAITGRRPPDSIDRMDEDELIPPSKLGAKILPNKENAILKAMSVQPKDRYQTMGEFRQALMGAPAAGSVGA